MTSLDTSAARERAARLNAYLRLIAPQGREAVRTGPFLATFDLERDNPFRNYAIPDDDARPSPGEIEAFAGISAARGRRPRLEYAPDAAPELEALLLAAGFSVELRPPLMTCGVADVREAPPPAGITLRVAADPDDFVLATRVQNAAYAEHNVPDGDPSALLEMVAGGGLLILAVETATGEPAGAGLYTPAAAGLTEVAGIGVTPAFRRRGIATALTSALTREAFQRGVTVAFLTPGGDQAQRAYTRAGFSVSGQMLMIGRG